MPKFQDLGEYAAAIAPVINAAHVNVHATAAQAVADLAATSGLTPGLLNDLRWTLPLRPLTRASLRVIHRYGEPPELDDHLAQGTLIEDQDGTLRPASEGLAFIHRLYLLHEAAIDRVWAGNDLPALAGLAGRLLDAADRLPGGALELVTPLYEPADASPGLLLFNRLAAFRYHRADAHAAAWQAAGPSATEIAGLRDGPVRAAIEAETNLRAAAPYRILTAQERETLYDGLLKLI
jgi:hypothetical protein